MFPSFRNGVHYCVADGRTVFLDVDANRYFCLPPGADQLFQTWLTNRKKALPSEVLTPFSEQGIIVDSTAWEIKGPCRREKPSQSAMSGRPVFPGFAATARIVLSQLLSLWQIRHGRLSDMIARLNVAPKISATEVPGAVDLANCARNFQSCALLIQAKDRCLSRSSALVRYLRRRGHDVDLVIGVKMNPFSAHAWVQHGETILNDTLDNVLPYTAILVV